MNHEKLTLLGVRQNNLKSLNLAIEHDQLVALTGLSGSGKSSLAFETIYAEGGRRYIETFSPYTRQFLDRLDRPDADIISGVRPALALEQRNRISNSRSTVGTVTEINDYLKLIWAHLGVLNCRACGREIIAGTPAEVLACLSANPSRQKAEYLAIGFPLHISGGVSRESLITTLSASGLIRFFRSQSQTIEKLEDLSADDLNQLASNELLIIVDRIAIEQPNAIDNTLDDTKKDNAAFSKEFRGRFVSSLLQCYRFGNNRAQLLLLQQNGGKLLPFHRSSHSLDYHCAYCNLDYTPPRPSNFTFNSPLGACDECHGFGFTLAVDPNLCIPDPSKSINNGAIACWNSASTKYELKQLKNFCRESKIDLDSPWHELSEKSRQLIFNASKKKDGFRGIFAWFKGLESKKYKLHVRVFLARHRSQYLCKTCNGSRLKESALLFKISDHTLPEIWQLPIDKALAFFEQLAAVHAGEEITEIAVAEVISRLQFLVDIGLEYLTLDRQSRTLSGGEVQRVNLTTFLGTRLTNTMLVLDEPSIGLHPRDSGRLIGILRELQARGNSVFVVEHDTEIIQACDEVIDLGPKAGELGGEIIFQGSPAELQKCKNSLTAQYLFQNYLERTAAPAKSIARKANNSQDLTLVIRGAQAHNLKNIDVQIPLNQLVVVTGVSGSGKSSLVSECLTSPYQKLRAGVPLSLLLKEPNCSISGLEGLEHLDDIILVDQSPVGTTPRSNAATYTKAWEVIRDALAATDSAASLGLSKSSFSFNVDGGRCPVCRGAGYERIEMQFLADAFVKCGACNGKRFQEQVLSVKLGGKNVAELLDLSLGEAAEFFSKLGDSDYSREISRRIAPLVTLGLGYLRLGQPLSQLSGGEAQRVKLASYLAEKTKQRLLFVLDEPTTGLHPHDIEKLLGAFAELIKHGHSVLCIEHNLFVISRADYLIDLGPDAGERGGEVVARGNLTSLLSDAKSIANSQTLQCLTAPPQRKRAETSKSKSKPIRRKSDAPISIRGARHHNLKNLSLEIPKNKLIVMTGVSGSGKSSLAFDILFAEGQRRYIDCLSPYAKQFVTLLQRADVDVVDSIPPTIAVSQKTAPPMGISTIATTTELYQYLRLLYAKVGEQRCPDHDLPIVNLSAEAISDELLESFSGRRLFIFAPVVTNRKGYYTEVFNRALRAEITEARVDGRLVSIEEDMRLERHKLHNISLLVGSLNAQQKSKDLLLSTLEQALLLGQGAVEVALEKKDAKPLTFSTDRVCPKCKRGFHKLDPQIFSFRSGHGCCPTCGGRGTSEDETSLCPACGGARISPLGRSVLIHGKPIYQLSSLTAPALRKFLDEHPFDNRLNPITEPILREVMSRLKMMEDIGLDYLSLDRDASTLSGGEAQRLRLVRTLGSPLTGVCYVLDEPTIGLHPTDHAQLLSTLQKLRDEGNTVLVVEHDEETILAADHIVDVGPGGGAAGGHIVASGTVSDLLKSKVSLTGQALRERLVTRPKQEVLAITSGEDQKFLTVVGATTNTLKNISVQIPLGKFTVVAGVSGSGKSSLVHGTLVPALIEDFEGSAKKKSSTAKQQTKRHWKALRGADALSRYIEIDQTPIGRTPSSTPASYLGIFDDIRKIFALLPEAKAQGWNPGHFSFNTKGGRCEECGGKGYLTIPMSFLPDATTLCESCNGMRYDRETLEVKFQNHSIGDVLQKTFVEARSIFANHRNVVRSIDYVIALGLGYLTLGQPTHTLSGGEAQRIKIATELGSSQAVDTLYILDEPTTGLHMTDVDRLLHVLEELVKKGNTVIVIEHNLDVIQRADYLIEMGPAPGERGGEVVYAGHPRGLLNSIVATPTKRALTAKPEANYQFSTTDAPTARRTRKSTTKNTDLVAD